MRCWLILLVAGAMGTAAANLESSKVTAKILTDAGSASQSLFSSATVCDLTLPFEDKNTPREETLDRFHHMGVSFVSLTVGSDTYGTAATVHNLANVRRMIGDRSDRMAFVRSVPEIRAAKVQGKLALGFHFQGSLALESNRVAQAVWE